MVNFKDVVESRAGMTVVMMLVAAVVTYISFELTCVGLMALFVYEVSGAHRGEMAKSDNNEKKAASAALLSWLTFCCWCAFRNHSTGGFLNITWIAMVTGAC